MAKGHISENIFSQNSGPSFRSVKAIFGQRNEKFKLRSSKWIKFSQPFVIYSILILESVIADSRIRCKSTTIEKCIPKKLCGHHACSMGQGVHLVVANFRITTNKLRVRASSRQVNGPHTTLVARIKSTKGLLYDSNGCSC